jgi:acyl-CoA oxidase
VCSQVARALLDDKSIAAAAPGPSQRVALAGAKSISPQQLLTLLALHETLLLANIRSAMSAAAAAAAGGAAGAAAAATAAFEDNLDYVVQLGWAHTEKWCMGVMLQEAQAAPAAAAKAGLRAMALLFGATRVERSLASYLAAGVLNGADAAALRAAVNKACRQLGGNGARPALVLCEAFGIPDHLLAAPIAFNWRRMGMDDD